MTSAEHRAEALRLRPADAPTGSFPLLERPMNAASRVGQSVPLRELLDHLDAARTEERRAADLHSYYFGELKTHALYEKAMAATDAASSELVARLRAVTDLADDWERKGYSAHLPGSLRAALDGEQR